MATGMRDTGEGRHLYTEENPLLLRTSNFIPIPENQQELDTLQPEFQRLMLIFQFISCITGIVGNALTVLAVTFSKKLQTINNFFIVHLAAVDLLIAGILVPININAELFDAGRASHCMILGPIIISVMALSLFSMANIALNRYFKVCRSPQIYAKIYKKKNIIIILILCYIYAVVLILPPFFGFSHWTEHVKFRTCLFAAYDLNSYIYGVGALSFLAIGPSASICLFSYYSIIKKFRGIRVKFSKVTPQVLSIGTSNETAGQDVEEGTMRMQQDTTTTTAEPLNLITMRSNTKKNVDSKTFKTILSLILVFVGFVICWGPMTIVFAIDFYGTWSAQIYVLMLSIAWLNSSINIVLYAALNVKFRQAYRQIITFKWKQLRNG